jgi:hypothetical protein
MLQACGDLDLAEEPIPAFTPAELGTHHLHRHRSLVANVLRQVDGSHPAGADHTLEQVPFGEGCRETLGDIAHRSENLSLPSPMPLL